MNEISQLINKLSWDTSEEEKLKAQMQLQYINEEDLPFLLQPNSKGHWDGAAEVIVSLGYPRVRSILPGLLEWIKDMNWPGAFTIANFLKTIGSPLIPYIKEVLQKHSSDEIWIEWIFIQVINEWTTEQIIQIKEELIRISQEKNNDIDAMRLIMFHELIPKQEILSQLELKRKSTEIDLQKLKDQFPEFNCEILNREFNDLLFKGDLLKQFYESNLEHFSFCNHKASLNQYLEDIDKFIIEVSYFA